MLRIALAAERKVDKQARRESLEQRRRLQAEDHRALPGRRELDWFKHAPFWLLHWKTFWLMYVTVLALVHLAISPKSAAREARDCLLLAPPHER